MLRIALCDDNITFLKSMLKLLTNEFTKHTGDFEIYDYSSGELLLIHHQQNPFNVIFLDIDMPEITGFEMAKQFHESTEDCHIIFVTSHSELVYDSFYFQPLNFITKGNDQLMSSKTSAVIDQLFNKMKQDKTIVLEDKDSSLVSTHMKDILYIESNKHYVIYHLKNEDLPITVRGNIGDLEDEYSEYDFVRIHKKYLVNLRHIFNIDKINETVVFKDGKEISMSRNYKSAVNDSFIQFLRRAK